jgi:tetratricopeptide (TPR) repeat protein
MKCLICESDNWVNVDKYRNVKKDMHMCKNCGFVSYPERYKKQDEMKEYYKNSYREPPTVNNLYTGMRKLHYHAKFLDPTIKKWASENKKDPVICDVGAAYGLFLNWWRVLKKENEAMPIFPDIKLYGVELTRSFKRNAYHEFGLELTDEFDESIDYDLITSYKVAEHIFDFDKHLLKYRKALKAKNGLLYISIPTWFRIMHNFGVGNNFDIEYYYHPDHVNVWTEAQFRYLLKKSGFEIIQEDHVIYDSTYLCKLADPVKDDSLLDGSLETIKKSLEAIKLAEQYQAKGDFQKAVETYPNFPQGWQGFYEKNRAAYDKKGWDAIQTDILDKLPKIDPYNMGFKMMAADLNMRYARWNEAIAILEESSKLKPNCANILRNLAQCYRCLAKDHAENMEQRKSFECLDTARKICRHIGQIDMSAFAEATNWTYNDNSKIPTPFEVS